MNPSHVAKVVRNEAAADGLFHLHLNVRGTPVAQEHRAPGQYLSVSLPEKGEAFFAIASPPPPKDGVLELLVKRGSPLADALSALPAGAEVRVSSVQGKGFPVEHARGKRVLLFATGSGISAVRSLVETLRRDRGAYGPISLYFGVRTPDAFAYADELRAWEQDHIRVVRTVSQPGSSGWEGLTGYVQSHVPEERMEGAVAFLCGQKAMVHGVTEALLRQGLPRDGIFLNY